MPCTYDTITGEEKKKQGRDNDGHGKRLGPGATKRRVPVIVTVLCGLMLICLFTSLYFWYISSYTYHGAAGYVSRLQRTKSGLLYRELEVAAQVAQIVIFRPYTPKRPSKAIDGRAGAI